MITFVGINLHDYKIAFEITKASQRHHLCTRYFTFGFIYLLGQELLYFSGC